MATSSLSSTMITNRDAKPRVLNNARVSKGAMQVTCGYVENVVSDAVGSKYKFCSIPSNARVVQLLLSCDSTGTSGAIDIGLYQTTDNGGAVVDADFFMTTKLLTSALTNSDVTYGNTGGLDIAEGEKAIWDALALTVDSKRDYDVVGTVTATIATAGSMFLQVAYVI